MSFARMVFARVYYAGGLKLAGIHGLEYMEAGFLAAAIDGDLVRGVGAVAGGELQGDVVCSGVEGDTRVRDGIGESLPVAGIRFFCQRVGDADGESEPFVLLSSRVFESLFCRDT